MSVYRTPLPNEVKSILASHETWQRTGGEAGRCADFSGMDLRGHNFYKKDLSNVQFNNCNLESVDMRDCCCYFTSFKNANLYNVSFSFSRFVSTNFFNADITFASFRGAKIMCDFFVYECYVGEDGDRKTFFDRSCANELMYENLRNGVFSYVKEAQLLKD